MIKGINANFLFSLNILNAYKKVLCPKKTINIVDNAWNPPCERDN